MGGYISPKLGSTAGEMRGEDLLRQNETAGRGLGLGLSCGTDNEGRIILGSLAEKTGPRCLVCRTSVSGWLRVYT